MKTAVSIDHVYGRYEASYTDVHGISHCFGISHDVAEMKRRLHRAFKSINPAEMDNIDITLTPAAIHASQP